MIDLYRLLKPGVFTIDPETAHGLTIKALASPFAPCVRRAPDPRLAVTAFGVDFPNPVGMAAGFDKNAEVADAVLRLGFGHVEVGTVTPRPQPGNPKPRMFRLPADHGVINRLGFNNQGHAAMRARLLARKGRDGVVGVNIGANKDAEDRIADYVAGVRAFADLATYFTVNISSPNTPGLRDLQARSQLAELLARVLAARDEIAAGGGRRVPVLLKIAPDVDDAGLDDIAAEALDQRLSGRPLFRRATVALAKMRLRVGPDLPIVGVGGIDSGETAYEKIVAGATLLQVYSGLVYEGPGLVGRILDHLAARMSRDGVAHVSELTGRWAERWAAADPDA